MDIFHKDFVLFVDFDGTITWQDVGEAIFRRFGNQPEVEYIIEDIKNFRISAHEGWMKLFNAAPAMTVPLVEAFTADFPIDRSFVQLKQFCQQYNLPLYVVSDGFDNYIRQILEREGLADVRVFSNTMQTALGKLVPVFPYRDEECLLCANCKRNHILENSADEAITVYVGNGSSDTCPAQFCDYIFAKDDLLKFCERERISFFPYRSFTDVVERMQELMDKKRLKKRHQAALKRMDVYKLG